MVDVSSKSVSMKNVLSFLGASIFSQHLLVMNLFVWILLLALVLWTFFPRPGAGHFQAFERSLHKYSGLDPNEWKLFQMNLREFDRDLKGPALYRAVENARNIGLMNTNFTDEVNAIADRLGYEGEVLLNQRAVADGTVFRPKYLNEVIPDQPQTLYLNDSKPMFTIDVNPVGRSPHIDALGGHTRA